MSIFAIIAPAGDARLTAAIDRVFPGRHLQFSPGQFVVSTTGLTSQQIAQSIGADGSVGKFVVFSVASHWGFHNKDLWEWLTVNAGP